MIARRSFITGLIALVAAPAIVRAGSLMPVKQMIELPTSVEVEVLGGCVSVGDIVTFGGSFFKDRLYVVTSVGPNGSWAASPWHQLSNA